MEIKEGIRRFAEQIIAWQIHAQTRWASDFPWEENVAVLLSKKTGAGYEGVLRAESRLSHSIGAIPQAQPS